MPSLLFGTDGVRGTPGTPPLDRETIARLGAALVRVLLDRGPGVDVPARLSRWSPRAPRLLVGRDTRESGEWIVRQLARGVTASGATLTDAGVLPTPAVAYLTAACGFDAGLAISASHNPYPDNGIKVLTSRGEKASEELEATIETVAADASWAATDEEPAIDRTDLTDRYVAHACRALADARALTACRIMLDCANGATSRVAPRVFTAVGLQVTTSHASPDGRNINQGCGSTHPEALAWAVAENRHQLGVAFDGDGDRAIFVDECGRIVDGDAILFICARHLKAQGRLVGNAVVATVMSNVGLELALRAEGIALTRCPVGDRYVMEELARRGLILGGEQSGHIIFREYLPTGDGIVTALATLQVMAETGRSLAELRQELVVYPQVLVNVRVRAKPDLAALADVQAAVGAAERRLGVNGRVLVRYSGTEPLLRIMIEGPDQATIQQLANAIADRVRARLAKDAV